MRYLGIEKIPMDSLINLSPIHPQHPLKETPSFAETPLSGPILLVSEDAHIQGGHPRSVLGFGVEGVGLVPRNLKQVRGHLLCTSMFATYLTLLYDPYITHF